MDGLCPSPFVNPQPPTPNPEYENMKISFSAEMGGKNEEGGRGVPGCTMSGKSCAGARACTFGFFRL